MPHVSGPDAFGDGTTTDRLAGEVREVESAIALVRSGAATRVTLTGLHFAEAVLRQLSLEVQREGIALDPLYWADDSGCDVVVRRTDVDA
ncbi:MAG TPA: hypothetical protein VF302_06825 [Candidatus Limnocylindrales bacterium]|jgi:hypothetical protein